MAEGSFTIAELQNGKTTINLKIANNPRAPPAQIKIIKFQEKIRYSFTQYLQGGLQINLLTCIDFTASNMSPDMPNSLHRIGPNPNQYQQAIQAVGNILLHYDHNKMVPTYGFGAKPKFPNLNSNIVSNFFPCSGDFQNTAGSGINGVFSLYQYANSNVVFSGPTLFAPLLAEVKEFTKANSSGNPFNYTVLLILTDGVIHDMQETISEIVKISALPLSIIIIGVGDEDFSMMEELDSDDKVPFLTNFSFWWIWQQGEQLFEIVFNLFHSISSGITRQPLRHRFWKNSPDKFRITMGELIFHQNRL